MNVGPVEGAGPSPSLDQQETRLHKACSELEAFIWTYAFRQAPDRAQGPFADGQGTQAFREMLDSERAKQVSKSGTHGLGDMLYQQLARRLSTPPEAGTK